MIIGIVGPCAAGKSTLISSLREVGYSCKHIAQEHSYVQDMWKRISNPDILIYLDVSYQVSLERRRMNWSEDEFNQQIYRLKNAKEYADFYLNTDQLTIDEVLKQTLEFLDSKHG